MNDAQAFIASIPDEQRSPFERSLLLSPDERKALFEGFDEDQLQALLWDWAFFGRPDQQWPEGDWSVLMLSGGRGSGKTKTGSELTREAVKRSPDESHFGLFAPTPSDARDIMIEGEAGLLRVHPPSEMPAYEPAKRRVTWPNKTWATIYTGADPDSGRGPNLAFAWLEELAKWKYMQAVWENFRLSARGGIEPKTVITTTPKNLLLIRRLIASEFGGTIMRRVSTLRNQLNLPARFIDENVRPLQGTPLGRQEVEGEVIEDVEGALWQMEMIDPHRVIRPPSLARIVTGVDPSNASTMGIPGMGRECGIVTVGRGYDREGYVLRDDSLHATPDRWGMEAALAYLESEADELAVEVNFGAAVLRQTMKTVVATIGRILVAIDTQAEIEEPYERQVAKRLQQMGPRARAAINVVEVKAMRGKKLRADPVVAKYATAQMHHVGAHELLEQQMTTWVAPENDPDGSGSNYSPDRIDALVWAALRSLVLGPSGPARIHAPRRDLVDPLRRKG